jgi:hypothetical protein
MQSGYYIETIDGVQKEIAWVEINQLKKDILWYFNENCGDPYNTYVPGDSFLLPYWEYLTLSSTLEAQRSKALQFLKEGALILLNGMICEYIPVFTGDKSIFGQTDFSTIEVYVSQFASTTKQQEDLKAITLLGLKVACETDFSNNEENPHPQYQDYLAKMVWVDDYFIKGYFRSMMRNT